jgi:GPH family glycoside/pentoside/hexuronide:cation symporter
MAPEPTPPTDAGPGPGARLSLRRRLFFGAPGFAGASLAIPIGVLMPRFYSDVVLVPLGAIAVAAALARSLDAITDPLMGWLSDRTRSRFGRRKPYIAGGLVPMALCFVALFAPPEHLDPARAAFWFGVSFGLFFLFTTIVEIPYAALGAELADDYQERSRLFGIRSLFAAAGAIVAALMPTILAGFGFEGERTIFRVMAIGYAGLLVLLNVGLLWQVPERPEFSEREPNPLIPGVRRALRNRPFAILLLAGITSAIPGATPAVLMPYFVEYVLGAAEPLAMTGLYLMVYLGAGLLFVPLWMAIARRAGKLQSFLGASSMGVAASLLYWFAGPGDFAFAGFVFFLTGTVSQAGAFLIPAMAADVIDYDELRTGKRREAQYTSFWALIPKFVSIPSYTVPLAVLAGVGYVPGVAQNESVLFWLRFMYSLFPAAFYVAALLILARYPISEAVHEAIRHGIAARAAGRAARDPLTGAALAPEAERAVPEADGWFLDHFSPRELRRLGGNGGSGERLVRAVGVAVGLSLVGFVALSGVALAAASDTTDPAPLTTVFAVVGAGLSLTAALFHGARLGAARRYARTPVAEETLRAHVEALEPRRSRGDPQRPDG